MIQEYRGEIANSGSEGEIENRELEAMTKIFAINVIQLISTLPKRRIVISKRIATKLPD